MNKLTLRIDNIGSLENGGPIYFEMTQGSATIGRKQAMDWSLPDSSRHISGHHIDVVSQDGITFVLYDRSSNGTFLQGDRFRLSGPHTIRSGDRFVIGPYIVSADIQPAPQSAPMPQPTPAPAPQPAAYEPAPAVDHMPPAPPVVPAPHTDPAGNSLQELAPLYGNEHLLSETAQPVSEPAAPDSFDDVWGDFAPAQDPGDSQPDAGAGIQSPTDFSIQQTGTGASNMQTPDFSKLSGAPVPHELSTPPMQIPSHTLNPLNSPDTHDPFEEPMGETPVADPHPEPVQLDVPQIEPHPAPIQTSTPQIEPEPTSTDYWGDVGGTPAAEIPPPPPNPQEVESGQFIQAFLEGAGVNSVAELQMDPLELARIAGQCARSGTMEMMAMLHERAAVKLFMSGEDRTMRVAAGNNPMKFLPDPDQAFQAMFLRPRDGYMTGAAAFQNSLSDIRTHQTAFIAALQPALSDMIEGLSPQDIENDVGSGSTLMGGGRRKYWDEFEKRWETRASEGENGMLDAFIKAFARHYSQAVRKAQDPGS